MSCTPGCSSISQDDLDRWSMNLSMMLDSPRARKKFNQFLTQRHLDEAELTLQFWEKCNSMLLEISHNPDLMMSNNCSKIDRERFLKNAMKLVEFAEEDINFDAAELREFRQTVETNDISQIKKVLKKARGSAQWLLRTEFELFRKNLFKELVVMNPKKKK